MTCRTASAWSFDSTSGVLSLGAGKNALRLAPPRGTAHGLSPAFLFTLLTESA